MKTPIKNNLRIHPSNSPKENLKILRRDNRIYFTNTGPRDTGQSDYKNRHTLYDLIQLAPVYNKSGYFSIENHGGARFHQDLLNNKINPFEEAAAWKEKMPDVLTQTLVRSTNLWGYRMYPRNVIALSIKAFLPYIDVWRCFDFLNYIPNMIPIAEEVMKDGKIFQPAISFTVSQEHTNAYYLKIAKEIIGITSGTDDIVLCLKDMAGVGSPKRIATLVDALLQKYPDLIIQYHRHATDGLAVPALVAAATAGVKILDVTDDPFSRYFGHAPIRPVVALLEENDLKVSLDPAEVDHSSEVVTTFIRNYQEFESQFRGFSYKVTEHKMPGGAFPSSFEQAVKGEFIDLMPYILKGMSYGNQLIKYFDVTPGSQISWTTWANIIQYHFKEGGHKEVQYLLDLCGRFIETGQSPERLNPEEQEFLMGIYSRATDDLKNLLLGRYGPLPFGWPADWIYQSVFGDIWKDKIKKERYDDSPLSRKQDDDIEDLKRKMEKKIGRHATFEELVLYLQHPTATVDFIAFRSRFGNTSVLPTKIWFEGLREAGHEVTFDIQGKPNLIKLLSIGKEVDGLKHIVLSVNNTMHVFPVEMPSYRARRREGPRFADSSNAGEVAAPTMGNVWRIGDKDRTIKIGDIVRKGQEILNIEAMKVENAVLAPKNGVIKEIPIKLNEGVVENQLLIVLEDARLSQQRKKSSRPKNNTKP